MRDMIHETPLLMAAAMMAHAANMEYCRILGDDSQLPWEDCAQWQKDSALAGVIAINENPDQHPEASHEGWLATKREDGWVYGEEKDPDAKTHPCMVPYADLPEDQRFKDTLFGAVVRAVLFGVSGAESMDRGEKAEGLERMVEDSGSLEGIGQPGDISRPMSDGDLHDIGIIFRQPIGATYDGEGLTIIFVDGGVVRWKQAHGWKDMAPVPGTRAAWAADEEASAAAPAEG